jgi:hypothetical protein
MSLKRSVTKRAPGPNADAPTAVKPKKGYDIIQQGMKQLYPSQDEIALVPEVEYAYQVTKQLTKHVADKFKV